MGASILGIDIAKDSYQVTLLHNGRTRRHTFHNKVEAFKELQKWLTAQGAKQVHACLEATGRYGEELSLFLHEAGHTVSIVNPASIHAYGQSKLVRTKTDRADADLIADYCLTQQPATWTPPAPELRELQALVRHRETLLHNRTQENNRLAALPNTSGSQTVRRLIKEHMTFLDAQIAQVEQQIKDLIDRHPDLRQQHDLLSSISGIGNITANILLSINLQAFSNTRAVSAFAGLNPATRQSGTSLHTRGAISKMGADFLRKALYMPAVSAARHNPVLRAFAERLRKRGKPEMVILVAVMRKLLCLAFGVLKSGKPFDPDFAKLIPDTA